MNKNVKRDLVLPKELFQLLEDDVDLYKDLLGLLGRERECLYSLSVEDLCSITKAKETEILKIKVLEETMRDMTGALLRAKVGPDEELSLSALAKVANVNHAKMLKGYLSILTRLKMSIEEENKYNKRFVEESLEYVEDAISIFVPRQNSPFYTPQGKNGRCSCSPAVVSREV
ncbi:MAG: flagellar protein FlgN [Pseudomonadota bacterium]